MFYITDLNAGIRYKVGDTEKCSALWATTQKNCHYAEQYNIFVSLSLLLKGQFTYSLKTHLTI